MSATGQTAFDPAGTKPVGGLSPAAPSHGDYALYIMEMSAELARIADRARLPEVIGYTLRMAFRAAQEHARDLGRGGPRSGAHIS